MDHWSKEYKQRKQTSVFTANRDELEAKLMEHAFEIDETVAALTRELETLKQVSDALRISEERYRQLFDVMPDGIVLLGTDGRIVRANAAQARMYLYDTPDDMVGIHAPQLVAPSSREYAAQIMGRRLSGETIPRVEYELIRKDGSTFYGETLAAILRDSEGVITGYLCVTRDTTDRRRAEDALRESERVLLESQSIGRLGSYILDLQTGQFETSIVLDELYGIDKTYDHTLEGWFALLHPDDHPQVVEYLQDIVENRKPAFDKEFRIVRLNDKATRWLHALGKLEVEPNGQLMKIHGTAQDITERKQAEKEKFKLESQLQQAQKMESVGRLAGGVAHDFNNMLSVIIGNAEMALEQVSPSSSLHDELKEIYDAARKSAEITRQLLAFARKQTIAPRVLDMNEVVAGMLKMLHRLIGEDIDLVWIPENPLWHVKIDPSQVEQILANLCVNARDAITGLGKITIETHKVPLSDMHDSVQDDLADGYVLLSVSDDGSGMDNETIDNIFEPFFTTKDMNQGTGLGLATVYGIVRQNNGLINVYSEPGKGSTFRIYFPRHRGAVEKVSAKIMTEIPMGRGETLLLVEDEPAIKKMSRNMLERLGYQVLAAGSPREALRLADDNSGKISLLITDVVMPGMSGRDLSEHLNMAYPDIKTLFMSGYSGRVITHKGVLDEGVNFIQKPFSMMDIAVKVRAVLDQEK